jgi:predicted PhzF superfamily epimerase YddE/YHI9
MELIMQFEKSQIIDMLKSQGDDAKASQAQSELPDQVDTDTHADLLSKFGLDPQDLISKLGGGGIGGVLGG